MLILRVLKIFFILAFVLFTAEVNAVEKDIHPFFSDLADDNSHIQNEIQELADLMKSSKQPIYFEQACLNQMDDVINNMQEYVHTYDEIKTATTFSSMDNRAFSAGMDLSMVDSSLGSAYKSHCQPELNISKIHEHINELYSKYFRYYRDLFLSVT